MANDYIPLSMRPHVLSIAYMRAAFEDVLRRVASMEARIAVQDRVIEQLLMGEDMGKKYEVGIKQNAIYRAKQAGLKAGLEGASDVVPVDIAQVPLQCVAWLNGFAEGKRMRAKQTAACL